MLGEYLLFGLLPRAAPTGAPAPIGTFPLFSVIVWII